MPKRFSSLTRLHHKCLRRSQLHLLRHRILLSCPTGGGAKESPIIYRGPDNRSLTPDSQGEIGEIGCPLPQRKGVACSTRMIASYHGHQALIADVLTEQSGKTENDQEQRPSGDPSAIVTVGHPLRGAKGGNEGSDKPPSNNQSALRTCQRPE